MLAQMARARYIRTVILSSCEVGRTYNAAIRHGRDRPDAAGSRDVVEAEFVDPLISL